MKHFVLTAIAIVTVLNSAPCNARFQIHAFDAQTDYADSVPDGIQIDPDGRLGLSGQLEEIWSSEEDSVCWKLAVGSKNTVFASTTDDGKVYRWSGQQMELFFDAPQVALFSLLAMGSGELLAGSAPDGIIYKIPASGPAVTFARTDTHYIWDLAPEPGGTVLAATGLPARVLRLDAQGTIINTVEVPVDHVRAIALDTAGRIWLATAGTGRIYELAGDDLRLVIDTGAAEISALVSGKDGLWFATVAAPTIQGSGSDRAEDMNPRERAGGKLDEKGSVWFMDYTDRAPREVWQTRAAPIFDLILVDDRPVMACGDNGSIVRLDADRRTTFLAGLPERSIVCLESDASGSLWAGAADTAAIYKFNTLRRRSGTLESPVMDAGHTARWGRFMVRGRNLTLDTLQLESRSGNSEEPGSEWSDWQPAAGGSRSIQSPPGRYLQWRITLTRQDNGSEPVVDTVEISCLTANQPPYIAGMKVFPVTRGRFVERPGRGKTYQQVMDDGTRIEYVFPNSNTTGFSKGDWLKLRGMRTVAWDAGDSDNEPLEYQIDISPNINPPSWYLLEENYPDSIFSFDSSVFPDGDYRIRITASDAPAHPAGQSLSAVRVGRIFQIDNTPPAIESLNGSIRGKSSDPGWSVRIKGTARDNLSRIIRLEYSLDTETWFNFTSTDDMLDGNVEPFDLMVSGTAKEPVPDTVFVKVTDAQENVTTSTITVDE